MSFSIYLTTLISFCATFSYPSLLIFHVQILNHAITTTTATTAAAAKLKLQQ
jgi:hypothetical protein